MGRRKLKFTQVKNYERLHSRKQVGRPKKKRVQSDSSYTSSSCSSLTELSTSSSSWSISSSSDVFSSSLRIQFYHHSCLRLHQIHPLHPRFQFQSFLLLAAKLSWNHYFQVYTYLILHGSPRLEVLSMLPFVKCLTNQVHLGRH